MFKHLLREPLLHFLLIGAALFGLYEVTGADKEADFSNAIHITAGDIKLLRESWLEQNGSAPDKNTLDQLIDSQIQEEILFREAKRLGLDKNDTIVRRRLIQKMRFLSANISQLQLPDDPMLMEYRNKNKQKYRTPETRSFTHVYFNDDLRGKALQVDVAQALQALTADEDRQTSAEYGDNFILQSHYKEASRARVAQVFGPGFADAVFAIDQGAWHGPVQSAYGTHLLRVHEVTASYLPELPDLREKLSGDLMREQLKNLKQKSYQQMRKRYQVTIE